MRDVVICEPVRTAVGGLGGGDFRRRLRRQAQLQSLEQQAQFRNQMGGLIGQTPWAMMNQLTERNMAMWKDFQNNLAGSVGQTPSTARPTKPDSKPNAKPDAKRGR